MQKRDDDSGKIFTIVEQMPQFPGGQKAMFKFIQSNIKYPDVAKKNNIHGKVYVNFYVDMNGSIITPKIVKGIGGGCDEEALRVVKMMPVWTPGKQNGHTVNVFYNIPVLFGDEESPHVQTLATKSPYENGVELLKQGKYEESIKEFDMAIELKESNVDAYYNRGVAKFRMRETSAACRDWSSAAHLGDNTVFYQLDKFCDSLIIYMGDTTRTSNNKVFMLVQEMPLFPGGEQAMYEFIGRNTKYPTHAIEKDIQGKVFVHFYIDKVGNVVNPKIIRGIGGGCDEEALRVISSMPRWTPGKQDGKPVNVSYEVPVSFKLLGKE